MKLAGQRWYSGTEEPRSVAVVEEEDWGDGIRWRIIDADGERYQVIVDDDGRDRVADPGVARRLLERTVPGASTESSRAMGAEQSNTSIVFDESIVVKLFRRLGQGPNLDVEVTSGLARVGFDAIAEPRGVWQRDELELAFAQRYLVGAADGWSLATTTPAFDDEAAALGRTTAAMHLALAEAFGVDGDRGLPSIRVHGDYHLGQVLQSQGPSGPSEPGNPLRWYVTDFEGEPARPVEERRRRRSPLVDVAGMLRSFDYAHHVGGHAREWEESCRRAFLTAYTETEGIGDLLPGDAATVGDRLREYEIEKAQYELRYEQAHRPDWVAIPEAALARLGEG